MPEAWDRRCEPSRVAIDLDLDPGVVLCSLRDDRLPFSLVGSWVAGGGAILGSEPLAVIRGEQALDLPQPACDSAPPGFVGGGWVGYYGYGLGATIERLPPPPPRPRPLPLAQMAFYDHVLRLDSEGRWWLEALWPEALECALERIGERLSAPVRRESWHLEPLRPAGAGGDGHLAAVAECVERIAAGEIFQANLCLRLEAGFSGSELDAFAAASAKLEPTHGAFIATGDGALLSFSPELFLRRRGGSVESGPIKGTVPRVDDPGVADAARQRLIGSAKDAAEHVMIVDLMRNDLGRVARYGSVHADAEPRVEPHPGLWHLVTTVSAELRDGVGDGELLRATFPPGSVTGAPKVQSLKVISELEGTAREAYTGAIGIVSPASGLELNVAIRTLEISGGSAWIGCGGGIVADSDPERELREALDKAAPIAAALGSSIASAPARPAAFLSSPVPHPPFVPRLSRRPDPARGLYETLRVRNGELVDLDRHLQRLADGLRLEHGVELPGGLRGDLMAAAVATDRSARCRVDVSPTGAATFELTPVPDGPPAGVCLRPVTVTGGLGARKLADREPLLALERPGRAGLLCDIDGSVLEATSANVWAVIDGELITPPADGRILPGITRDRILELGAVAGHRVREREVGLDRLRAAAIVLISSSVRIAAAAAIEGPHGEPISPSAEAEELAAAVRAALDRGAGGYPPGGANEPAADWMRPAQTALAPRSPTLHTM